MKNVFVKTKSSHFECIGEHAVCNSIRILMSKRVTWCKIDIAFVILPVMRKLLPMHKGNFLLAITFSIALNILEMSNRSLLSGRYTADKYNTVFCTPHFCKIASGVDKALWFCFNFGS